MKLKILKRLFVCFFVVALAIFLTRNESTGETIFCAVVGGIGAAGFLLVRPTVSTLQRFRMIGIWDLMMPVMLTVYMTVDNLDDLEKNTIRLVFMSVFIAGSGTAARLIFNRKKYGPS